jgi:hypothetical protein
VPQRLVHEIEVLVHPGGICLHATQVDSLSRREQRSDEERPLIRAGEQRIAEVTEGQYPDACTDEVVDFYKG